jgi:hypothetical protein
MTAVQGQANWLKDHIVIASFIGKKIAQPQLADWIQSINTKISPNSFSSRIDMGRGFIFLEIVNVEATRKIIALTPHSIPWGTSIY